MDARRVYLYMRCSGEDQDTSIETQTKVCHAYAKKHKLTIVDTFIDEGISGYKKEAVRTEFIRLLDSCRDKGTQDAEFILIWRMDRFTRQGLLGERDLIDVRIAGLGLISTLEGEYSNDVAGRIKSTIDIDQGEKYIINLIEAVKGGHERARERGTPHGVAPYGYMIQRFQLEGWKKDRPSWIPDPETSPVVVEVFKLYSGGTRCTQILKKLHKDGIKAKNGKDWSLASLQGMLRNPAYGGFQAPKKDQLKIRPLKYITTFMSRELWESVFYTIHNKKLKRPEKMKQNPLTGIVVCGECGSNCHSINGNSKYARYRCRQITNASCDQKDSVSIPMLEATILDFWKGMTKKAGVKKLAKRIIKLEMGEQKKRQKSIQHLLDREAELKVKIENMTDAIEEADGSIPVLVKRLVKLNMELEELQDKIEGSDVELSPMSEKDALDAVESILKESTDMRSIATLVDSITILEQDRVSLDALGSTVTLDIPRN